MPGAKFWAFLFFSMLAMVGLGKNTYLASLFDNADIARQLYEYLHGTFSK